jgi:hypothetical protein
MVSCFAVTLHEASAGWMRADAILDGYCERHRNHEVTIGTAHVKMTGRPIDSASAGGASSWIGDARETGAASSSGPLLPGR